jgi:phosphatidate cytidylyltransferase
MLLKRILTALALLPPVVAAVFLAPAPWLYAIFAAAALLAAWEWTGLMGWGLPAGGARRPLYVLAAAALLAAAWFASTQWQLLAAVAVAWWLVALALLPGFPGNLARHRPGALLLGALGPLLWLPTVTSLCLIRAAPHGAWRLIYVFVLVWAADVGAYFAGQALGRHKLAPRVSPGKTIEGAVGGLLLCLAWALLAVPYVFRPPAPAGEAALLGLSLLAAILSIVGDLSISMFKRLSGVKDSGHLLPGHGGILDRIDSLMAAAPVMALGLYWLHP